VTGYFYNPNIHPYREFKKRINSVRQFAQLAELEIDIETKYGLKKFIRQVVFKENQRCPICYQMRLDKTAQKAAEAGMDGFSTTLLYSRYQKHEQIKTIGETIADQYGLLFYYDDFRVGWQQGIDTSLAMDLYRQPYCGCIYSEQERYDKKFKKTGKP
jgi:predicted adenine nucleotide alpha hydrolase (AANH) superfamily ATPase